MRKSLQLGEVLPIGLPVPCLHFARLKLAGPVSEVALGRPQI